MAKRYNTVVAKREPYNADDMRNYYRQKKVVFKLGGEVNWDAGKSKNTERIDNKIEWKVLFAKKVRITLAAIVAVADNGGDYKKGSAEKQNCWADKRKVVCKNFCDSTKPIAIKIEVGVCYEYYEAWKQT